MANNAVAQTKNISAIKSETMDLQNIVAQLQQQQANCSGVLFAPPPQYQPAPPTYNMAPPHIAYATPSVPAYIDVQSPPQQQTYQLPDQTTQQNNQQLGQGHGRGYDRGHGRHGRGGQGGQVQYGTQPTASMGPLMVPSKDPGTLLPLPTNQYNIVPSQSLCGTQIGPTSPSGISNPSNHSGNHAYCQHGS